MDIEYENEICEMNPGENEEMMMYFKNEPGEKDSFYQISVFQIAACLILSVLILLMSFFGGFKGKISQAAEYFQSFELTGTDIKNEVSAMRDFLNNESV